MTLPPRASSASERPSELLLAWPYPAQVALAALLLLVPAGMFLARSNRSDAVPPHAAEVVSGLRLDLNQARASELVQLPGIGPTLADRIVAFRELHGPFTGIDQLRRVPGIGVKTVESLRPWLAIHEPAGEPPRTQPLLATVQDRPKSGKELARADQPLIDLNRAGGAELQKLPGIGPKLAQRIVEARGQRPFATVEDLRRVPGIGPKTLAKVRPFVTIEAAPGKLALADCPE